MQDLRRFIYHFPLRATLAWALIIFVLCATPGSYIPNNSWLDLLSVDKLVHTGIFFLLACLSFFTVLRQNAHTLVIGLVLLLCVAYGASLEWMQANWFIQRTADWADIVANSTGCVAAMLMLKFLRRKARRVE